MGFEDEMQYLPIILPLLICLTAFGLRGPSRKSGVTSAVLYESVEKIDFESSFKGCWRVTVVKVARDKPKPIPSAAWGRNIGNIGRRKSEAMLRLLLGT
jgi:hypothetical protein